MNFLKRFSGSAMKEKMKPFLAQYGRVAIYTYVVFSLGDLAAWYVIVSRGFDVKSLMKKVGLKVDEEKFQNPSKAGNFMIALLIHKADFPLRLPVVLACVPFVAKVLGKTKKVI